MKQWGILIAIVLLQISILVLLVYQSGPSASVENAPKVLTDSIPRGIWNGQTPPQFSVNDAEMYMTEPSLISKDRRVLVYMVYIKADGRYLLHFSQTHAPWESDFVWDLNNAQRNATGYKAQLGITFAFGNAESVHSTCEIMHIEGEDVFLTKLDCYDIIRFVQYDLRSIKLVLDGGGATVWPIDDPSAIQRHLFSVLERTAFLHQ